MKFWEAATRDPESKPTTAQANKLARDIESLFRECEQIVQHAADRDGAKVTAGALFKAEFFGRAIFVCDADGSVSEQEAALFCEMFADLMPQLNLKRGDVQTASKLMREKSITARQLFEKNRTPTVWNDLERNDHLSGTAYASRYRELVLRMITMFAFAEGARSETKLMCVADIKEAISPLFGSPPRELARDIDSLVRDCESLLQPLLDKETARKTTVAELLKWDFCGFAICER